MEENEANSSLDALDEDILVEIGEYKYASKGGVAASMNDLEIPPIYDNDEGYSEDDINENKDHVDEKNDYIVININYFLG